MKTIEEIPVMESRTVALLTGLAIGFGIAVHPFFFIVALAIALIVTLEWTAHHAVAYLHYFRVAYRYV